MTANQLGFDPPNRLRPEHQHHKMLEVRVLYREVQTLKVLLPITRGKSSLRPRLPGKEDRGVDKDYQVPFYHSQSRVTMDKRQGD